MKWRIVHDTRVGACEYQRIPAGHAPNNPIRWHSRARPGTTNVIGYITIGYIIDGHVMKWRIVHDKSVGACEYQRIPADHAPNNPIRWHSRARLGTPQMIGYITETGT